MPGAMVGNLVDIFGEAHCGLADARRPSAGRLEATMEPAKIKTWQRFREQVLEDQSWPRGLWFSALEDGLQAALGEDSPLLADLRRDRAELLVLERRASGAYQDARRTEQLEAQIRELIELAEQTVTGSDPDRDPAVPHLAAPDPVASAAAAEGAEVALPRRRAAPPRTLVLATGMLMLALGAAGASVYHETRRMAEAEEQSARIDRLLEEHAAGLRAELERRLAADDDAASGVAGELRARSAALARALDELSLDVSSLEMRLPALGKELDRVAAGAGQMADELARTGAEIDALKAAAPELTAWLGRQRDDLEQVVQSRHQALIGITGRVENLAAEIDESRALLTDLNQSLLAGLQQAGEDGEALRSAVDEMRATGLEVAKLMDGAELKVQVAHDAMQAKIDQMLSALAEQADLAVLRGADVISRAEGALARRVEASSAAALDAVAKERATQLAALAEQVSATQLELEKTQAALIASWERMDQSVAERQSEVLTSLDAYAGTIGVRVEELLQALDVIVARSGG
jgi:hypothetical protein